MTGVMKTASILEHQPCMFSWKWATFSISQSIIQSKTCHCTPTLLVCGHSFNKLLIYTLQPGKFDFPVTTKWQCCYL